MLLITNNPKTLSDGSPQFSRLEKLSIEGSYGDVLMTVRDKIHKGHKLLSHPLSGSVKPNETPYKSVLVSKEIGELELEGLVIIENSIETYRKFLNINGISRLNTELIDPEILSDFAEIDHSLIKSAILTLV